MFDSMAIWLFDLPDDRLQRLRRLTRVTVFLLLLAMLSCTLQLQTSWWWLSLELPLVAINLAAVFLGIALDGEDYERCEVLS